MRILNMHAHKLVLSMLGPTSNGFIYIVLLFALFMVPYSHAFLFTPEQYMHPSSTVVHGNDEYDVVDYEDNLFDAGKGSSIKSYNFLYLHSMQIPNPYLHNSEKKICTVLRYHLDRPALQLFFLSIFSIPSYNYSPGVARY